MLWNCIIILLFANIVKLTEVTIPSLTQKKGLQAHSLHTRVSRQPCRNKAWVVFGENRAGENGDLGTVPCWQGKGSTKDTNRNSSGTPFLFSSVPCYKECIFCLTADPLLFSAALGGFCSGFVFFKLQIQQGTVSNPAFGAVVQSGYCSLKNWVLMLSWSPRYSLTFNWHCKTSA